MTITFKPYVRKNGSLMLYINRSNGVSVGIAPENGFSPYGKNTTQGQRNAYEAAVAAFDASAVPFTGDLKAHAEGGLCKPVECAGFTLVGTDMGNIGGMPVDSDGAYIVRGNKILKCGKPVEEA